MPSSNKGRTIKLFYIDGNPDGMLTAEVFNWTGHVLYFPRTHISEALKRDQAGYSGVYLLFGDLDGNALAYIGESEEISDRIRNHVKNKDWWTHAVLITAAGNKLNKAHAKYLEARLIQEAESVGRIALDNGNSPSPPSLSESDRSDMEVFLEYILMVLPTLKIDSFVMNIRPTLTPPDVERSADASQVFETFLKKEDIHATAVLLNGEFIVQEGSMARNAWVGDKTDKTYYWKLFEELVLQGILKDSEQGNCKVFSENYMFNSTSAAGAVVLGRSCAGPRTWKVKGTNQTYREWEVQELSKVPEGEA